MSCFPGPVENASILQESHVLKNMILCDVLMGARIE